MKREFRLLEEAIFFFFNILFYLEKKKLGTFNFSNFFIMLQLRGKYVSSVKISLSREKHTYFGVLEVPYSIQSVIFIYPLVNSQM